MKSRILAVVFCPLLIIPFSAYGFTYQIDPDHSSFQFKVRHLTVSNVKGDFSRAKGFVILDDQNITDLKVELTIDASSVHTGHAKRDEHLRGADFFDVAKFPHITFVSKRVTKTDGNRLRVVGNLTIRGVTKEVTVDVEGPTPEIKDPWGGFRRGATGTTRINRKDFGILWNRVLDTGGVVVGDEVDIYIEIELVRK
jgi:polyisoprenoid-binding protein YceI